MHNLKINKTAFNIFIASEIFLLFIISIFDLLNAGYTTNDDAVLAIQLGPETSIFRLSYISAVAQGRVGFFWGFSFLQVPYLFESRAWYLFVKFTIVLCLVYSVFVLCKRLFTREVGVLAATICIAILQNGWDHNALTSYPFAISFVATLFIVALILFDVAIKNNNLYTTVASAILLFLTFTSELFVVMSIGFVFIYLKEKSLSYKNIKKDAAHIMIMVASILIYVLIYLIWRSYYQTSYDGNKVGNFNVISIVSVISAYSFSAFPYLSIRELMQVFSSNFNQGVDYFVDWMIGVGPVCYVKGLLTTGLVFITCSKVDSAVISARQYLKYSLVFFAFIFIPNILLGLTDRHAGWVKSGVTSYLYTYYSAISAAIFMALVVLAMISIFSRAVNYFKIMLFCAISICFGIVAFATALHNKNIANEQVLSNDKWVIVDQLIKSNFFSEIPDGAIISAATLTAHYKGIMVAPASYWEAYIKRKTSKKITLSDRKCDHKIECYELIYQQSNSRDQSIVIYKKEYNSEYDAKKVAIFRFPSRTQSLLLIPKKAVAEERDLTVGLSDVYTTQNNLYGVIESTGKNAVDVIEITGGSLFNPKAIIFGVFGDNPHKLISYQMADGFYSQESSKDVGKWNWASGKASIIINNGSSSARMVKLSFRIFSLNDMKMEIKSQGCISNFALKKNSEQLITVNCLVKPGNDIVEFIPSGESFRIPPDDRLLNFRLIDFKMVIKE